MSGIKLQQSERLGRSPHDLTSVWKLEALVAVPLPQYPQISHFWVCGISSSAEPATPAQLDAIEKAARRVDMQTEGDAVRVVVDGKYVAGDFHLKNNYSEPEVEIAAAECATRTAWQLSQGQQPSDLRMAPLIR